MFTLPAAVRCPGEGENAFAAFSDYLAMGWDIRGEVPRRIARLSLERVQRTHQPQLVDAWMKTFDWEERANLYDSAIVQSAAGAVRDVVIVGQVNLSSFATMASAVLMAEFERSLDGMRRKGQTIDPVKLVDMAEKLVKALGALAPPNPDEGRRYSPDLGGYPEDATIAEECIRLGLQPGEPPIPGLTDGPVGVAK